MNKKTKQILALLSCVCCVSMIGTSFASAAGIKSDDEEIYDSAYPARFDLRERGVVTPVKSQLGWGTCWSFGAIAAAESSILSEMGKTYDEYPLDFSERQLAWFAGTPLPADDPFGQGGEGNYDITDISGLDYGGRSIYPTVIFGTDTGPVPEQLIPYQGIKEDGSITYDPEGDWSVDEQYRRYFSYELENANILPGTVIFDEDYNYAGLDADAVEKIKSELYMGRGIQAAFCADVYDAARAEYMKELGIENYYLNGETWAHYTHDGSWANHQVCIVGWDDNYPKENFLTRGYNDEKGCYEDIPQPPGDGAWIVKNSWGGNENPEDNPNYEVWGIDGSGYFYISYYDKSICDFESYDFKTDSFNDEQLTLAYDYLPGQFDYYLEGDTSDSYSMANIFVVDDTDTDIVAVEADTPAQNSDINYKIYLLNDDFTSPVDGELVLDIDRSFEYAGFHKVYLDEPVNVPAGKYFSVVTTITTDGKSITAVKYGMNEAALPVYTEMYGFEYTNYCVGVINKNESYFCVDGEWNDLTDICDEYKEAIFEEEAPYLAIDNFSIKAYAVPSEAKEKNNEESIIPAPDSIVSNSNTGNVGAKTYLAVIFAAVSVAAVTRRKKH